MAIYQNKYLQSIESSQFAKTERKLTHLERTIFFYSLSADFQFEETEWYMNLMMEKIVCFDVSRRQNNCTRDVCVKIFIFSGFQLRYYVSE